MAEAETEVVRCDHCQRDGATLFCTFIPDPEAEIAPPAWLQAVFDERESFDTTPDGRGLWRLNFCEDCARAMGLPDMAVG